MKLKNEDLNKKWSDHNQIRLSGNKKLANKLLNIFIESILLSEEYIIEDFVYQVCSTILKNDFISTNGADVSNTEYRVQYPLFQKVIIPIFVKKYKENNPLYIRWISQFEQFFYTNWETTSAFLEEINGELREVVQFSKETNQYEIIKYRVFSTDFFLKKSIELELNQNTLYLLLKRISQDIDYYTHELPSGILTDADYFIEVINQFKNYYEKYHDKNIWKNRIQEWTDIANHWKIYSLEKDKFKSFEEYLKENGT